MNRSMRTVMLGGMACLVVVSMALTMRTGPKVLADDVGAGPVCSVATLNGRFAFLRTGQNNNLPGPIAQLGVTIFDGRGNTTGTSLLVSRNGDIEGQFDLGSAPYVVNADCTGYIANPDGTPGEPYVVVSHGQKVIGLSNLPGRVVTFVLEKE